MWRWQSPMGQGEYLKSRSWPWVTGGKQSLQPISRLWSLCRGKENGEITNIPEPPKCLVAMLTWVRMLLFPGRRAYGRCSAPGWKSFEAGKQNNIAVRERPVLAKCVQVIQFWRELWAIDRNQLWQPGKEQVGQAVCSWASLCHL